ncbi:MAG: hypothetical protein K2J13_05080, partial [Clostridia bacterium]|nr:hypothetical protein [Clostridia bacterium]
MAKKNYTLEELKSKNLFQLRDLARKLGVENATYLSEELLIDSIYALNANSKKQASEPTETNVDVQAEETSAQKQGVYSEEDFKNMTIHTLR